MSSCDNTDDDNDDDEKLNYLFIHGFICSNILILPSAPSILHLIYKGQIIHNIQYIQKCTQK